MLFRSLLLAALESGPQRVLSSVTMPGGPIKRPSAPVLRQNRIALGKENAKIREELHRKRDRLSAADTSIILDRHIRRLDQAENCDPAKLKGLIDQKMKLEELVNPGQDEVIDPRKVLGKLGLAGMSEAYIKGLSTLCAHRTELSELWAGIVSQVVFTVMDDVEQGAKLPKGINAETFRYIATLAGEMEGATEQPEPKVHPESAEETEPADEPVEVARETPEGDDGPIEVTF